MNIQPYSQETTHDWVIHLTQHQAELPQKFASFLKKQCNANEVSTLLFPDADTIIAFVKQENNPNANAEKARVLAHEVFEKLSCLSIGNAVLKSDLDTHTTKAFLEGFLLSSYRFDKYQKIKKNVTLDTLFVNLESQDIQELLSLHRSISQIRDWVNEPVNHLNTRAFSSAIKNFGTRCGLEVEVLERKQIETLKMGGLLGVNQGSSDTPTFNILTWKPDNAINQKPYVFVGKGVVYDTGGYNIKPGQYMDTMKADMAGAAAVVGILSAVSQQKLPLYVVGLIPATDNRINSDALVSDDIITMMDGTTVEIKNTDAEGRLILADALVFAQKYQPELVIDLATLTGAAARVTSHYGSAMMGNADHKHKQLLKDCGEAVFERLTELPFWDEFSEDLKSSVADLKNIGNPEGGASSAGKFLEHFTSYPWIHLDIAGTAFLSRPYKYFDAGATGVGVRLLYHFLKCQIQ